MTQKIDPQYVRFDTAKLLKEKGFANIQIDYGLNQMLNQSNPPEQWQVVEWLRVNHGIWISTSTVMKVEPDFIKVKKGTFSFSYHICWATEKQFTVNYNKPVIWGDGFITPQEAMEAGILYVLNNLI
jgi:hypothetical protein